jgi:hypothetical protein
VNQQPIKVGCYLPSDEGFKTFPEGEGSKAPGDGRGVFGLRAV